MNRNTRHSGFTLLELVLVMTMLVTVLAVSYRVIVDCLDTDRNIDRIALPEKVGAGVISLLRRDLTGTFYRQLGPQVFRVIDEGDGDTASDQLHLLTTVPPTPLEEAAGDTSEVVELHTITGVQYFLARNGEVANAEAYTLFRKEMVELDPDSPLDSPGIAYEVYDKVAYINIECFDGVNWNPDWDSESQIALEVEELELLREEQEGRIGRVSDGAAGANPGDPAGLDPFGPPELPPTAVPVAVRIEVGIFGGRGNQVDVDQSGEPVLKTFVNTVPLISATRLPLELEPGLDEFGGGFGGGEDSANTTNALGGAPMGAGGGGAASGSGRRGSGSGSGRRRSIREGSRP